MNQFTKLFNTLGFLLLFVSILLVQPVTVSAQTPGLLAAYGFNDTANPLADSSGNNNTLVCIEGSNCPIYTQIEGHNSSGAFDYSGAGNYLTIPNESVFDFTKYLTVSFWMKDNGFDTAWEALVVKGDSAWSVERYRTYRYVALSTRSGFSWNYTYPTVIVDNNTWHHVTVTYSGTQKKVYIDGVLRRSANYSGTLSSNNTPVTIGYNLEFTSGDYGGLLDDIRLYNRALSQAEIVADMNTPVAPPITPTPTVTPTPSFTPTPTNTPTPTFTPTPTPTETLTPTPTETLTPTPTPTSTVTPIPTPTQPPVPMGGALRVNPNNPRYFTNDSGASVMLTGTHTWRNFQAFGEGYPPQESFDFPTYLTFLKSNNINFMRLWTWEQIKGPAGYPDNYLVYPHPFARTGPGNASDGQLKFDLSSLNQDYFDRLRQHVISAAEQQIYVSVQLFNGWSVTSKSGGIDPWPNHPFNGVNNVNGINPANGLLTQTLANPAITSIQETYVRKVIDTLNDLDNVLYEIANETAADSETIAWQNHIINLIHAYELTQPKQHPVGFSVPYPGGDNAALFASNADFVTPNEYDSSGYNYKNNPRPNDSSKVIISDTDHLWGLGGDRIWAWKSFTRGILPSYMDCYIEDAVGCPISQNDPARLSLLANLGHIRTFANQMNLNTMTPQGALSSTGYVLSNAGNVYLIYQPQTGPFTINLTSTTNSFALLWLNPQNAATTQAGLISGGTVQTLTPPFSGDAIAYLTQSDTPSPTPTPTLTPTSTVTPTPSFTPTPTPTNTPSPTPSFTPTPTPTETVTPTPSPTVTMTPTPTPTPVTTGLVAAYNFNEGTGTTIADISGNNNFGTVTSPSWTTGGKFGAALVFGTQERRVRVSDDDTLDLNNTMTLEAWVYPTSGLSSEAWRTVIMKEVPGTYAYCLYANGAFNTPFYLINYGGHEEAAYSSGTLPLNTWTHLAATYDGATLKLYRNGVLISSASYSGSVIPSTGELNIGGNNIWTNEIFIGRIDEVRLYSRALTASEIQSDMNSPI